MVLVVGVEVGGIARHTGIVAWLALKGNLSGSWARAHAFGGGFRHACGESRKDAGGLPVRAAPLRIGYEHLPGETTLRRREDEVALGRVAIGYGQGPIQVIFEVIVHEGVGRPRLARLADAELLAHVVDCAGERPLRFPGDRCVLDHCLIKLDEVGFKLFLGCP